MFTEVDVFIGNNTLVDPIIYEHWLEGLTGTALACLFTALQVE